MTLRTLMVGLDALEVTVVDRLLAEGRLPNLARFAARAVRLEISSDGANLHGTLWPTFAAGVGPGWHGIYQWMQWIAEEMRHRRNDHPLSALRPVLGAHLQCWPPRECPRCPVRASGLRDQRTNDCWLGVARRGGA